MFVILFLLFVSTFAQKEEECTRSWYYLENPTYDQEQQALKGGCFHGSYGPISLLSCEIEGSKFLSDQDCGSRLCVVETPRTEELIHKIDPKDSKVLLIAGEAHVLSSKSEIHSCLDLDINRVDVNINTVSEEAWKPITRRPDNLVFNLTAPDPFIEFVLSKVEPTRMDGFIKTLSAFHSRQSTSEGALQAQEYLEGTYKKLGFTVTTEEFRTGMRRNVIAEIKGTVNPDEIVCVGAHYDSRGPSVNDATQRAPGADDNASGSSNLLELATLIFEQNIKFDKTLRLLSFCGEEQGLVGSRAYAKSLADKKQNVIAMFNGDMLGWRIPGQPITLGMNDRNVDLDLLAKANEITKTYVPSIDIGISRACCSDHQSFYEYGFSSLGYFENIRLATDYPHYHKVTDLPQYINVEQLALESKAIMAAALTYAGARRV